MGRVSGGPGDRLQEKLLQPLPGMPLQFAGAFTMLQAFTARVCDKDALGIADACIALGKFVKGETAE